MGHVRIRPVARAVYSMELVQMLEPFETLFH
jgi:hypothetical protein